MGWVTVYVRGRTGFKSEVIKHLEDSEFTFMPGFANERGLALYWIPEEEALRTFKKAIGSKIILKYRLRFYSSVEDLVETKFNAKPAQLELN